MTIASIRANARRRGFPDPIFYAADLCPRGDGGFDMTGLRPLPAEYGGDGRTLESERAIIDQSKPVPAQTETLDLDEVIQRVARGGRR